MSRRTHALRRIVWGLAVAALATLAARTEVAAQLVTGSVSDASTGAALGGALVRLLNLDGEEVWSSLTDDSGWFALRSSEPGEYLLEAQRIGYRTSRAGPVRLEATRATEVELRLMAQAIPLDSVTVTVEARQTVLERAGFYARKEGEGVFIDRAEIERRRAVSVPALLQGRRGVFVMAVPGGGLRVVLRGGVSTSVGAGQFCAPRIFVDGMAVDSLDLEREIHPADLDGVEVYASPSMVPPQFGGAHASCGVILFWSRSTGERPHPGETHSPESGHGSRVGAPITPFDRSSGARAGQDA